MLISSFFRRRSVRTVHSFHSALLSDLVRRQRCSDLARATHALRSLGIPQEPHSIGNRCGCPLYGLTTHLSTASYVLQLSKLSTTQLAIIKNTELLAFHQDSTVGAPAAPFTPAGVTATSPPEFYAGKSVKGTHVFVLNIGSASTTKKFDFASVTGLSGSSFKVHDMWAGKDLGTFSGTYSITVDAHDNAALLITAA